MISSRLLTVATLLGTLAGGCAHTLPIESVAGGDTPLPTGLLAEDLGTQSLFRVHYGGRAGSGAFRLVLKLESADRYLVETRDRFGRGLWRIAAAPTGTVLVDDRQDLFCVSDGEIRIPEMALETLPIRELPAILLGRLPGGLEPGASEGEYRDRQGRRWTVAVAGARLSRWTVWQAGEPWLWWLQEAAGQGVLSHRAGTQLRWRRVAGEPLIGEIPPLSLTPGHIEIGCEDWPTSAENAADGH